MALKVNGEVNLYDLIGTDPNADHATIRKAYRRKALDCHPDKNPDNPKAAELFHQLSNALEILLDPTARAAFDKILNAKKNAELRNKQLSSKRQKLKSDLEHREKKLNSELFKSDEEVLKEQILRLRREGSKMLEEEQRLMREQIHRTMNETIPRNPITLNDAEGNRIKIKWKSNQDDVTNGGYNEHILGQFFKKYGDINILVMSKKNGSALVEFGSHDAAQMAFAYERGCLQNPLQLSWLKQPETSRKTRETARDFEDLVLRKLRQAEERRKLIEEIQKEDAEI